MALAVADNASFTRASQQLYVAQSAISRKIKLLEDELGEPIFERVNSRSLITEEMVAVTSPKHPVLSQRNRMKAEELQDYPLILFPKGARTRDVLDESFQKVGIAPRIVMEAENVALIKPLVKIDLGISIIRLRSVSEELQRGELHCMKIRNHRVVRQVGLVYHKSDHIPKILAELIRLFKEVQHRETQQLASTPQP